MTDDSPGNLWKILALRIVLGLLGALLLTRFFLPASGPGMVLLTAGVLVFFAYVFEYIHHHGMKN
jgi:hypothetical protein